MKLKCVVLDACTLTEHGPHQVAPPGEPSWESLAELVDLSVYSRTKPEETVERAQNASLILTNKVVLGKCEIDALPALKYIGVLATGTNVVDLVAAKARGVVVCNVPGYATESVVEHVFALILELCLGAAEHAHAVANGAWQRSSDFSFRLRPTVELSGKTIGIVGFGTIGKRVASVAHAFGMEVIVARSHTGQNTPESFVPVSYVTMDELFARADIVSLHCPLVPETQGLVNAARIAQMKKGALLINTGRGPLIDEEAVSAALHSGHLGGAGLDVLSREPPGAFHPLINAPRCLVTPHIAWATQAARTRLMNTITSNVAAFLAGSPENLVNR